MIPTVRSISSGKEKKKTHRSNNSYKMELIDTKMTPRLVYQPALRKKKERERDQTKNLGINSGFFFC
jgi:hypothetical protein